MVSRVDKNRMTLFVADRLEDSGLYNILERDHSHILVAEKSDIREKPQTIDVVAHGSKMTLDEFRVLESENRVNGVYTSHIFYKDGKTFMVRLAERGNSRRNKSLKCYPKEQLDAMIHLRDLEKFVLGKSGSSRIDYYQPQTERLTEGIRIYSMGNVELDYSHIAQGDQGFGFVKDKISTDYKLPLETETATSSPVKLNLKSNMGAEIVASADHLIKHSDHKQ